MPTLSNHKDGPTIYVRLIWQGPYSYGELGQLGESIKRTHGVYQIYGTSITNGPDTLLYIGRSENVINRNLGDQRWSMLEDLSSQPKFYFGFIYEKDLNIYEKYSESVFKINKHSYKELIARELIHKIEGILVQYCTPTFNSSGINQKSTNIIPTNFHILNYGRHHRLPCEVSNLWDKLHPKFDADQQGKGDEGKWYNEFKSFW